MVFAAHRLPIGTQGRLLLRYLKPGNILYGFLRLRREPGPDVVLQVDPEQRFATPKSIVLGILGIRLAVIDNHLVGHIHMFVQEQ